MLRDSCLLSYDSDDLDKIVEPQTCVCLGKCKVQLLDDEEELNKLVGGLINCAGKKYCVHITTRPDKEHVLLCCSSAEDRKEWVDSIKIARTITHANMVKLSVENRVLAEEKGATEVALAEESSALVIFSNPEYIQKTPIAGGAEGWLKTVGFKKAHAENEGKKGKFANMMDGLFGPSELKKLKKRYCILRDSHLMLYDAGDALLKPRGVMYLVGTEVEHLADDETGTFRFRCGSPECGDYIDFVASTEKRRRKWVFALKIASRVTYPDFRILMQEHQLLASVTMTPRITPNQPTMQAITGPVISLDDVDLQDAQVDPGTEQPYDENGQPFLRSPEGKLVDLSGNDVVPATPRFDAGGAQLDNFNRPLPAGAVPMFTNDGQPIGVGPDGQHYLADGTIVSQDEAHFDVKGEQLSPDQIRAAGAIAQHINVALKVHAKLNPGASETAVDVLGRTFREANHDGQFVNADGLVVPPASARQYRAATGELVDYNALQDASRKGVLKIVVEDGGDHQHDDFGVEIGNIEVDSKTTLKDIRYAIQVDVEKHFPDFLFLLDMTPMLKYEESNFKAIDCLPAIQIRGKEVTTVAPKSVFSKKVSEMLESEERKKQEQREFENILNRVRAGKFLKPVKESILDP